MKTIEKLNPYALLVVSALLLYSCSRDPVPPATSPSPAPSTSDATASTGAEAVPGAENGTVQGKSGEEIAAYFFSLLPKDTLFTGTLPSLIEAQKQLELGEMIKSRFSTSRRGLRPLDALESIGASLNNAETWQRLGISPRTPLMAGLVDEFTMIVGLQTLGSQAAEPPLTLAITAIAGSPPLREALPGGGVRLVFPGNRVWAQLQEEILLLVFTSGAENPTDVARSLGNPVATPLSKSGAFAQAWGKVGEGQLVKLFLNLEQLLENELGELRAEKHGSWRHAEKLLNLSKEQNKPDRVIQHWEEKVEAERLWSKEHSPALRAAADALEKAYQGVQGVGLEASLSPYGFKGTVRALMAPESPLGQLFASPLPTRIATTREGKDEAPVWVAFNLAREAALKVLSPLKNAGLPEALLSILRAEEADGSGSWAYESGAAGNEGTLWHGAFGVKGDSEARLPESIAKLQQDSWKVQKALGAVSISNSDGFPFRELENEGNATLVGALRMAHLVGFLLEETKVVPPASEDPVERAIEEEMNEIRIKRDSAMKDATAEWLKALGTLNFRVVPTGEGWDLRLDLVTTGGPAATLEAWKTYWASIENIEKTASSGLAGKRREIRNSEKAQRKSPFDLQAP